MDRDLSRRRFVVGIATTGIATTLAGCGGDGGGDGGSGGGDGGDGGDGTSTGGDPTDGAGGETTVGRSTENGGTTTVTFDYTFVDGDSVVGSSLTGIAVDYPEPGALSTATVGGLTLGGGDASRDIQGTATSNEGATYTISLGGENTIESGDELVLELANVAAPPGSYDATVRINPQSGATKFTESF